MCMKKNLKVTFSVEDGPKTYEKELIIIFIGPDYNDDELQSDFFFINKRCSWN